MKLFTILLLLLAISLVSASLTKLSTQELNKMSPHEVNELMNKLIHELDNTQDAAERAAYLETISRLLKVSTEHIDHVSWYYKVTSIVSFTNVIALLICVIAIIFFVSLFYDIIITFGILTLEIVILLMSGHIKFYLSYFLFGYSLYYDPPMFRYLGNTTLVFYWLCFYLMSKWHYAVLYSNNKKGDPYETYVFFIIILTAAVTILHNNSFLGTITILLVLYWNGCVIEKINNRYEKGVAVGFDSKRSLKSTVRLSTVLTSVFVMIKLNYIQLAPSFEPKVALFETGVLFWCPLFCCIGLLILSNWGDFRLLESVISLAILILHSYFGYLIDSNSLICISHLFLVLWIFNLEWSYLSEIGIRKVWMVSGVILINLYALYYTGINYPHLLMLA
jgi:hypothetical protein